MVDRGHAPHSMQRQDFLYLRGELDRLAMHVRRGRDTRLLRLDPVPATPHASRYQYTSRHRGPLYGLKSNP
jgi:hypothetical protein